jgi:outer membrane protein assembly factor BamA
VIRKLYALFLVILFASALHAQETTPTRFLIERIEVRNLHRVSRDIIVSESLLHEGGEYSEQDLRDASLRLSRLPFLLSADFSLEKGSERGKHVLVISIAETKPFFYLFDMRPNLKDESRQVPADYADYLGSDTNEGALGYRVFVGRRGLVHGGVTSRHDNASFTTDYSSVAVGYTQYDVFGTHAFVSLNLRQPFGTAEAGALSPQVVVGIPLTTNQTLTLDYEQTRFRNRTELVGGRYEVDRQDAERLMSLTWTYNTTNQPFVPTRGTLVRVAPLWSARDRALYTWNQIVS